MTTNATDNHTVYGAQHAERTGGRHLLSRHTHRKWLKFLKLLDEKTPAHKPLRLIAANYRAHMHLVLIHWLKRHPRFYTHIALTAASWLSMIERFFRDLSRQRIRRGSFASVHNLTSAVQSHGTQHNHKPKPFVWTGKTFEILEKVKHARPMLNTERIGQDPGCKMIYKLALYYRKSSITRTASASSTIRTASG